MIAQELSPHQKKVLITGSGGFTSLYLKNILKTKQYKIYGINHSALNSFSETTEYVGDITNIQQIKAIIKKIQPDYILHLAAISYVASQKEEDFYRVNLFGTLNILQALYEEKLNPKKIIIASSANVYGDSKENYISENICPKPVNHYGNSKLAMENMVTSSWFDKFPIIITRPFNYTGIGQPEHFLIPKIVRHFQTRAKTIELGNIDVIRDISDVQFIAESYIRLMENKNLHSEIFNLCAGQGYSIKEILNYLHEMAGYKIHVEVNPSLVRKNEIKALIGSNEKLFNAVGEIPIIPLKDIIKKMYQH